MGNMLPCLVQGSTRILPPMNTKHWSRSMKLLVRTLRRSTTTRPRGNSNRRVKAASAATRSSRETSSADQQAAAPRTTRRGGPRSGQSRRAVRVRVVLTRAEAARLLSLTAHGDRTAAQVGCELKRMQATSSSSAKASTAQAINELKRMEELAARANTSAASAAWRPVLESIPEEWQ